MKLKEFITRATKNFDEKDPEEFDEESVESSAQLDYELVFHLRTNVDDPVLNEVADIDIDDVNKIVNVGVTER